jgi:hypothetical protein
VDARGSATKPSRRETNRDGLRAGWRNGVGAGFCETEAALFWECAILIGLI